MWKEELQEFISNRPDLIDGEIEVELIKELQRLWQINGEDFELKEYSHLDTFVFAKGGSRVQIPKRLRGWNLSGPTRPITKSKQPDIPTKQIETIRNVEPTFFRQEKRSLYNEDEFEMTLLPWQISKQPNKDFNDLSLEGQIAYKALMVFLLDVTTIHVEKRLEAIKEMYLWMNDDARRAKFQPGEDGFEYPFDYWCEQLGVDEGYMRRKLRLFLARCTKSAKGVEL